MPELGRAERPHADFDKTYNLDTIRELEHRLSLVRSRIERFFSVSEHIQIPVTRKADYCPKCGIREVAGEFKYCRLCAGALQRNVGYEAKFSLAEIVCNIDPKEFGEIVAEIALGEACIRESPYDLSEILIERKGARS